jgi:hypothetical protein
MIQIINDVSTRLLKLVEKTGFDKDTMGVQVCR